MHNTSKDPIAEQARKNRRYAWIAAVAAVLLLAGSLYWRLVSPPTPGTAPTQSAGAESAP